MLSVFAVGILQFFQTQFLECDHFIGVVPDTGGEDVTGYNPIHGLLSQSQQRHPICCRNIVGSGRPLVHTMLPSAFEQMLVGFGALLQPLLFLELDACDTLSFLLLTFGDMDGVDLGVPFGRRNLLPCLLVGDPYIRRCVLLAQSFLGMDNLVYFAW